MSVFLKDYLLAASADIPQHWHFHAWFLPQLYEDLRKPHELIFSYMMFFCIKSDLSKRIKRIDKCVGCDAKVRTRQRCARARGWAELSCQSCPRAPASAHQLHAHTHAAGGNSSSCVCVHCFSTRVRACIWIFKRACVWASDAGRESGI